MQSFNLDKAINDIYEFMKSDELFSAVLDEFGATSEDLSEIISGMMMAGAGATYRGHYVPVSALLFPDTLAYLLRSQRSDVDKAEAYFEVLDYFQTGAIRFQPKAQFHT